MKIFYSPKYEVDLGPHILPTVKFRLIKERLIELGIPRAGAFEELPPARDDDILLVHTPAYLDKFRRGTLTAGELAVLDLPFSPGLAEAAWIGVEGTIRAARYALETGLGIHIGGGGHHAYPDHGAGYCVFNDVAIAIRTLQRRGRIVKGMGVDCGSPAGGGDEESLAELSRHVLPAVEVFRPQLLIYVAGADPYQDDQEGGLKLTFAGLERRDQIIFQEAKRKRVPVAVVLAGGYARRTADTVAVHVATPRTGDR